MWKSLAFSFRMLRRSPVFTAAAALSLALGIGANTAIFSLIDQALLRMLPVRDPQRLVLLHREYTPNGTSSSDNFESVFSNPMYRELRDRDQAFAGVIARSGSSVTLAWQGSAEYGRAEVVSGNFFQVLGVGAAAGRMLTPADDGASGANPVAVLSYSYWEKRFGASPSVLNQTITMNGFPMVVVGVAARRFKGIQPGDTPSIFIPISMKAQASPTIGPIDQDPQFRWLNIFARLKPGISISKAQAATDVVYRSILESELPRMGNMRSDRARNEFLNHKVEVRQASQGVNSLRRQWRDPLMVLMAMSGLVLLIACANVAALMLARATSRQREIAVRLAMGATRWALVRQLLLEGVLLAVCGGALGLLVASWSSEFLIKALPGDAEGGWLTAGIDGRLLAFNMALAIASGLLFSLAPALQSTRPDIAGALKSGSRGGASPAGPARFRQAMVTAQMALSLVLVTGAGLFTMSLIRLTAVNFGFRTERLLCFNLDAALTRHDAASANAFYRDVTDRISRIPGVTAVGAAANGPFSNSNSGGNLTVEGYQAKEEESVGASRVAAGAGFFRALGIPLREGREFSARDAAGATKVVVVNEAFVKRYFAGRDPIGRHLMFGASNKPVLDREIVGVAADIRGAAREPAKETVFTPYEQSPKPERLMFYVRASGDESQIAGAVRQAVRAADPGLPINDLESMDLHIRDSIYADRLIAMLAGAFGALATLLAALGLYGVVAYAVARRTSEIGIRMAVGASPGGVLRMVLWEAGRMVGLGLALGLAAAIALGRLVQSQLFGINAAAPAIYAGAVAVLAVVAFAAALAPGWRAARIDPISALKYE